MPLNPQQFMSTWQKVQPADGLERQDVVSPSAGIVLETMDEKLLGIGTYPNPRAPTDRPLVALSGSSCAHRASVPVAFGRAGLSKVEGLDPKPENKVYAGKFASVPVMLRTSPMQPAPQPRDALSRLLLLFVLTLRSASRRAQERSRTCRPGRSG